ncbi:hypothetical protein [Xenorhabdus hominickii]|uniref:Uncharacterized protein n=1 Tax=Xenorhabdus hominickii TaxID=351679 RepID=A0A2G0QEY0_XENHO|nr:hypothetical protein [Xenorhabdus hominickii]AOM41794.1 hypothetical protein A9255_15250 [Xenorhabdus hominickii]PHM57761.1 hypothetical protein Xhom_00759 [Xenorhabdus hominickii]
MLTIPFDLFGFADQMVKEPEYIIFISTFGLFIPFFVFAILQRIPPFRFISNIVLGTLALSLFPNFIVSITFFFLNVSGIHLFFICLIIILSCFFFILFNYQQLANYMENPFSGREPEIIGKKCGNK